MSLLLNVSLTRYGGSELLFNRHKKYAVWHIYWCDELVCRVLTKSEAEKLEDILGHGYTYRKETYYNDKN